MNEKCKVCKESFASKLYYEQRGSSKQRGHPMPDYTRIDFLEWVLSQEIFHEIYKNWQDSGFIWGLMPSGDRLDDDRPYTFDNLQIVIWDFNRSKSQNSKRKPVSCFTKDGELLKDFESLNAAARYFKGYASVIKRVCDGVPQKGKKKKGGGYYYQTHKVAYGYHWSYKDK